MAYFALKSNPFTSDKVKVWEEAERQVGPAAEEAAQAASAVLVAATRKRAERMAWPQGTIDQIQVLDDYRIGIPDGAYSQRANELEYGTDTHGPQAVLRKATLRSRKEAQAVFQEHLAAGIFGEA